MPTRFKVGPWHRRNFFMKGALWTLSQTLGCFYFAFDLLNWLLRAKNTTDGEFNWWQNILLLWWSSVDRSNKWIGKTITIIEHIPGEY